MVRDNSMIFGVGTGRCGTKSLAVQLGGMHEPEPWLREEPARYKCDRDNYYRESLLEHLRTRSELPVPIVVDLKHSYVIDLICEVDPDATFVWIRDPVDCISSFINGGAWTRTDWHGSRNWRPFGGWPKEISREMRVVGYWIEVNKMIENSLLKSERDYRLVKTESLTVRENVYARKFRIEGELLELVENTCRPHYDQWIECHWNGKGPE